jgi:hypothetical protein
MHKETASAHKAPSQGGTDDEGEQDQQNPGADAYKPPHPVHHEERRSEYQVGEETTHE